MDLRSHYPFWLLKHGIVKTYASVQESIKTDVVVMGAGITGALVSYHLCKAGFDVVMVDRRHVGQGSTAASTCLLQYEIDTPLHKLISIVGEKSAVRSYKLCLEAVHKLQAMAANFKYVEFTPKPSFQFASFKKDVKKLETEYSLRKKHHISSVQWLEEKDIFNKFSFKAPAGILSEDAAQLDAYRMTHSLIHTSVRRGLQIFDGTEVVKIKHHKRSVELLTDTGNTITARKLVICCGYESQRYIPKQVEELYSTYAVISEPFQQDRFWYKNSLIWETARPYLYLRTTSDNRILIGGKDDKFYNPDKRDANLPLKSAQLVKTFHKLFPAIEFRPDFEWAGTFCNTKDGLPYIGSISQRPNTYFALGFGGNGITFSHIAAEIITDLLQGKKNEDAAIFTFAR
ncbi:NAD(P)/FAD-dependent oxidoreductase [Ohtaekwangia koreensis]|uniref:Glycine/D-amino acid oxidase n=1 Tax=Ohtaekwangia koreensis TaxID=688867 RepID=A0A1T5L7U6_9BACT|nr:FAD-binding oxidoreductase [Ohtaekwangia koreensis]SKC71699.1 Glycine/D-amino acid oxidase [Ohtaekwangia koreensis]